MTIFPPYFLVYDQTLLAVPLVMLWSSPAWRWGVALFATMTALAAYLSLPRDLASPHSVALATMFACGNAARQESRRWAHYATSRGDE